MSASEFPTKAPNLGSAEWETDAPRYRSGAIWLGRCAAGNPIGVEDDRHIVCVAGSRAGKGRSAIVPNLALWPSSCVVVDPKGENATKTARLRQSMPDHKVLVIDPFAVADVPNELRATFNPLSLIDDTDENCIDVAAAIGDALIVSTGKQDSHWDESARQLIEALILHVAVTARPEQRTLARVRKLLMEGDREIMEQDEGTDPFAALWGDMVHCEAPRVEAVADVIRGGAESVLSMGDNERGSVLSTARRNTKFLDSPAIKRAVQDSSFNLDELKSRVGGLSLYVSLPARFISTHARFLRVIINLILFRMEAMGLEKPVCGSSVLFVLDEFASLGRLDAIEKAAGLMAAYGVKLWPILQDITQLQNHYEQSWQTFLANAGVLQFFGNSDLATLEWIEKRAGQTQVIIETSGSSRAEQDGSSTTESLSETKGSQKSVGTSEGQSKMAPLSAVAARQSGQSLFDSFARGGASDLSLSAGSTNAESFSASNAETKASGRSSSVTESTSISRAAQVRPLCRIDEIARYFDRSTGLQVVFIGGGRPLVLKRTAYDLDPQFSALDLG